MSTHPIKYLICYDVSNPRRLRRVHRTVRDWGIPVQFSVFEVELNAIQLTQLISKLTDLIDAREDKILFYQLGQNHDRISLGLSVPTEDLLFI